MISIGRGDEESERIVEYMSPLDVGEEKLCQLANRKHLAKDSFTICEKEEESEPKTITESTSNNTNLNIMNKTRSGMVLDEMELVEKVDPESFGIRDYYGLN